MNIGDHMKLLYGVLILVIATSTSCGVQEGGFFGRPQDKRTFEGVPRFVLLQGQRLVAGGSTVPVVVRMDTTTGESWTLEAGSPTKWVGVEDSLRWGGKYDPKSKKLLWGVSLPDGRDLKDLSREELIRYLETTIRSRTSGDPNDPLGIRSPAKPETPR